MQGLQIAQLVEASPMVARQACLVELGKGVRPQIGGGHVVTPHVVEAHEPRLGDGDHRFLLASPSPQALNLGSQLGARRATDPPDPCSPDGAPVIRPRGGWITSSRESRCYAAPAAISS